MMCSGDLQRWGRSLNVRVAPSQTKYERRIFLCERLSPQLWITNPNELTTMEDGIRLPRLELCF